MLLWTFLLDSLPSRRRQRYGDADFDWDYRVDTTSATVRWQDRLLGLLHSPYQPTEPGLFREMMEALSIDFHEFAFIDIGSGKGRTLLMASEYPFTKIIGIELLPALHEIAQKNIAGYKSEPQACRNIVSVCQDASEFQFPDEPLVLYFFNPLPESGLREFLGKLEQSIVEKPRPICVLYQNPLLEYVLAESRGLVKVGGTHQYVVYRDQTPSLRNRYNSGN